MPANRLMTGLGFIPGLMSMNQLIGMVTERQWETIVMQPSTSMLGAGFICLTLVVMAHYSIRKAEDGKRYTFVSYDNINSIKGLPWKEQIILSRFGSGPGLPHISHPMS